MIHDYWRLLSECPTINQVNRLHISLESLFTPSELLYFWDMVCVQTEFWDDAASLNTRVEPNALRHACVSWLDKLKNLHDLSGKPDPEPYLRRELTRTVILFTDGKPAEGKSLLVCFCGSGHRPMMPAMTFAQCLDASRTDFALLRDLPFKWYQNGLANVADTLDELQVELPKLLRFDRYRRIGVLGISGGGVPALLSALRWDSPAVVAVGPNNPARRQWQKESGENVGHDLHRARETSKTERITIAYGAQSPTDRTAAEALAGYIPVELMEVVDPENPVYHNALYPILRQGRLPAFLEEAYQLAAP